MRSLLLPSPRCAVALVTLSFSAAFFLAGCRCEKEEAEESGAVELEESPPEETPEAVEIFEGGVERCRVPAASSPFTLRSPSPLAQEEDEPDVEAGLELGSAIPFGEGYAVGLLVLGKETRAEIVLGERSGAGRRVDLGVVHGDVNPPRLTAFGDQILAVVEDNDAGGRLLRVVRISPGAGDAIARGPEISEGRDESSAVALRVASDGRALLVWDVEDRSRAASKLERLSFDAASWVADPKSGFSDALGDEEGPVLVERTGGHWLVSQDFERLSGERGAGQADGLGVLEEPRSRLVVRPLDARGSPVGQPSILVAAPVSISGYDAARGADDTLVVVYRVTDPPGHRGTHVVWLRLDGSRETRTLPEALEVSAPLLLSRPTPGAAPWLFSRDVGGTPRLEVLTPTAAIDARPEVSLRSREPLAALGSGLLTLESRGVDVDLRVLDCDERAPGPEPQPEPAPAP